MGSQTSTSQATQARAQKSRSQVVPVGGHAPSSPASFSLPKGGGAIRGLNEQFALEPSTGTAKLEVPLPVGTGRNGSAPSLSLSYDSAGGNSPFGIGWSLNILAITRKTDKGVPRYEDDDSKDTFLLSGFDDLTPTSGPQLIEGYVVRRYRPRVDHQFARIEWWCGSNSDASHWRVITRDNMTHVFGFTPDARLSDPEQPSRIYQWLIELTFDQNGNSTAYRYRAEDLVSVDRSKTSEVHRTSGLAKFAGRHIEYILHGNVAPFFALDGEDYWSAVRKEVLRAALPDAPWLFRVGFDYSEAADEQYSDLIDNARWSARPDAFSSYRAGFEVRNLRLCRRICFETRISTESPEEGVGYIGATHCLVLRYSSPISPGSSVEESSSTLVGAPARLASIQQVHFQRSDGSGQPELFAWPPLELSYTELGPATWHVPSDAALPGLSKSFAGGGIRWIDLDAEGLPGALVQTGSHWHFAPNRADPARTAASDRSCGTGGEFRLTHPIASTPAPRETGALVLTDLAGSGRVDIVSAVGATAFLSERRDDLTWSPPKPLAGQPAWPLTDPSLRFIDLSGDGRPDLLVSEGDCFLWQEGLGSDGFGRVHQSSKAVDEKFGPRCVFDNTAESIHLADMSGDGLLDIVRVRNGEVCYWPNLGHGRFGAKILMDSCPTFDEPNQFDATRLRLLDVDGKGCTDIAYLSRRGVELWFNLSGNAWSEKRYFAFPMLHSHSAVSVVDFFGRGTNCLVWSSMAIGSQPGEVHVLDLAGGAKPHLLASFRNNLGSETRIRYRSSTSYFLADMAQGRPWKTRLPFPVHVVEQVEAHDIIGRHRHVSRYAYRHGYFDPEDREFRGFGMVERWDSEQLATLHAPADNEPLVEAPCSPPARTRTWFHHGAWYPGSSLHDEIRSEFWAGDSLATKLEPDMLPPEVRAHEMHEATRALRGRVWREEIYADDADGLTDAAAVQRANRPYRVVEHRYAVRQLEAGRSDARPVFLIHHRETLKANHDRAREDDPRTEHTVTLAVDDYGNVLQAASLAYRRRSTELQGLDPAAPPGLESDDVLSQQRTHFSLQLEVFTNAVAGEAHRWRTPQSCERRTLELVSKEWSAATWLTLDQLRAAAEQWKKLPILPAHEAWTPEQRGYRLLEHSRTYFRSEDLRRDLPLGQTGASAWPAERFDLVLTPRHLELLSEKVDAQEAVGILTSEHAGYRDLDGDGFLWAPLGRTYFAAEAGVGSQAAALELAHAKKHFFLPYRSTDPFGRATRFGYDRHGLHLTSMVDAVGNTTKAGYDYRVQKAAWVIDPNGNRISAAYDGRGMICAVAIEGDRAGRLTGDSLVSVSADLTAQQADAFWLSPADSAPSVLGSATVRYVNDPMCHYLASDDAKAKTPVYTATLQRQFHSTLPFEGDAKARKLAGLDSFALSDHIQCQLTYSDGFGRAIQQRTRVAGDPGTGTPPVPGPERWVVSGWTVFNNKGLPVREYEPFFAARTAPTSRPHGFEFGVASGVSPVHFYDALDRRVATLHPDGSWEKRVDGPWQSQHFDRNDTVLSDPTSDVDVGAWFRALNQEEWPLVNGRFPTWHVLRTSGEAALSVLFPGDSPQAKWRRAQERVAALKTEAHANTPQTVHLDPLGRAFAVVEHNRFTDVRTKATKDEFAHTRTQFDAAGQVLGVVDALGRVTMQWTRDLKGHALQEASIDSGRRWHLLDVQGQPLRRWDSRDQSFRFTYDDLRRPLERWVARVNELTGNQVPTEVCFERRTYGDSPVASAVPNGRGRLWKLQDTAGELVFERYDPKGNAERTLRRFCQDYRGTPDWSQAPPLEPKVYVTEAVFDALDRTIRAVAPDDHHGQPGSHTYRLYGVGGQLSAVTVYAQAPSRFFGSFHWEPFYVVRALDYNARGQVRMVQFGNNAGGYGLRTTSRFDERTFRLAEQVTINKGAAGQPKRYQALSYAYDPVGNVSAVQDAAQATFYFRQQAASPDADYVYDALYRLVQASGREHIGQNLPPNAWDTQRSGSFGAGCSFQPFANPGDPNAMRLYTERFVYDAVGNLEELRHDLSGPGSWRRQFSYETEAGNPRKRSNRLMRAQAVGTSEQFSYDAHGNVRSMAHLPEMQMDFRDQMSSSVRQQVRCAADRPASAGERTYYVYDAEGERARKVTERNGRRIYERRYLGDSESYQEFEPGSSTSLVLERLSLHVMDEERRFALFETRTRGDDEAPRQVIRSQFPNHLGSTCLEVRFDPEAPIISYEEFHPYGTTAYLAVNRDIRAAAKRFRFSGKERDEESGLNYHRARYLATWLCRWTTADPSGLDDGPNPYVYARQNPVRHTDPDGRISVGAVVGTSAAIVIGVVAAPVIAGAALGLGASTAVAAVIGAVGSAVVSGGIGSVTELAIDGQVTMAGAAREFGAGALGGLGGLVLGGALAKGASLIARTGIGQKVASAVSNSSAGKFAAAWFKAEGGRSVAALQKVAGSAGAKLQALVQKLETHADKSLSGLRARLTDNAAKGNGATGKLGETVLKALGGESQVFFRTSQGGRYIDQFVNGVAHESKVGYKALTSDIRRQIAKDVELMTTKQIQGSTWHFFQSPVTGVGGPSQPLMKALQDSGINVIVH